LKTWAATVAHAEAGTRLDRWLAGRLPDLSRTRLRALIEGGQVRVGAKIELRPGRVVLSTPHGYEWLAEEAWPVVAALVPRSWELVVRPAHALEPEDLTRAA